MAAARPLGPAPITHAVRLISTLRLCLTSSTRVSLPWRKRRGPLRHSDLAVRFALQRRRIQPQQFAPPPQTLRPLFSRRREPVLPNNGAHLARWCAWEWVCRKKGEHVCVTREQPHFGAGHNRIGAPPAQRCEP